MKESRKHKEKHKKYLSKVSPLTIASFFSDIKGIPFGTPDDFNAQGIIYRVCKEPVLKNPREGGPPPTPDLAVIYIHERYNLGLIECKANVGGFTPKNLRDQERRTKEETITEKVITRFLKSLQDPLLSEDIIEQIYEAGIEYYRARITNNGGLIHLIDVQDINLTNI